MRQEYQCSTDGKKNINMMEINMTRKGVIIGIVLIVVVTGVLTFLRFRKPGPAEEDITAELQPGGRDAVVRPVPLRIDVNNFDDGIYPVAFERSEVEKEEGGCAITFEIFNMDLYDAVELHCMEVGGYIEIGGEIVKIESLSTDGNVIINGGLDNGGAELIPVGGGVYRYQGWDDIATYTSFGKVRLFVPDTIDFVDLGNVEKSMKGVTVPGKKTFDYLTTTEFGSFNQYSTRIRIDNGAVVEFFREYRP